MNPLLVDSCKNSKTKSCANVEEDNFKSSTSIKSIKEYGVTAEEPCVSYFYDEAYKKDNLLKSYEETYKEVMLDPDGIYIQSQIFLEEEMFSQMLQKRPKLKINAFYYNNLKRIVYQIAKKFLLKQIGNSLKEETTELVCEETYQAMFALFQSLENCFDNKNILEQFYNSYHFPNEVLELFKSKFPYTEDLPPYKTEDFEIMTAPVTPNEEDDMFLASTYGHISKVMDGDKELGRLFAILVMLSPVDAKLSYEESMILKKLQSQVGIIMFNHILSKEEETIVTASKKLSELVSIVKDLIKCGHILLNMIFVPEQNDLYSIDSISVTPIL